jgi:integrase
MYCDGGGLYLQVSKAKHGGVNRSWVFRYSVRNGDGKSRLRDMGLGPVTTLSLAEARDKARLLRQQRLDGVDPIEAKRARHAKAKADAAGLLTFDQAALAYLKEHEGLWKSPVHRRQWRHSVAAYASPVIGKLAVRLIDTSHITAILDPIWSVQPGSASKLRGRIEQVLDWAKVRGHRDGENPARWRGHLDHVYPSPGKARQAMRAQNGHSEHHAAMPYVEIAAFMQQLRARDGVVARALEFTILTAARTGEVLGARWSEISLADKVWVLPPSRTKNGREHRVPLCERTLAIIHEQAQLRHSPFVFPGQREGQQLHPATLYTLLKNMGCEATVHGFRSSFRDWAAEQTAFPREVCEAALAHAVGDQAELAYKRTDFILKRARLMQAWADYCDRPASTDNVVALHA